jgi:hypothetical protein
MNNCRACLSSELFTFHIKTEQFEVCSNCFLVMGEANNTPELPEKELAENICNNYKLDNSIIYNTANDFNTSSSGKNLVHDRSQLLAYSDNLDNYFTRIYNKFTKDGLLVIELYPTNCYITYFKFLARTKNYFTTKTMKLLVEKNGLFLLSTLYLSSPSHQIFVIGKNPQMYKELQNIKEVIAYESSIGVCNLKSYRDMENTYREEI